MSVADKLKRITVADYDYEIRQGRHKQYEKEKEKEEQQAQENMKHVQHSREAYLSDLQEQAQANTQHSRETYLAGMQQRAAEMSDEELDAEINRLQADRPQGSEKSSGINRFFGTLLTGTGNNKGAADLYGKAERDEENKIKLGAYRSTLSPLLKEKDRRQSAERQSVYKTMTAAQLRTAYESSTDSQEKSEIYTAMGDKLLDGLSPRQKKILDDYRNADYAVKGANAGALVGAITGSINYNSSAQFERSEARKAVVKEFGKDWALYADLYDRRLNAEEAEKRNTRAAQFADRHPVLGSAAAAAANLYKPAALAEVVEAALESRPIDPNSPYFEGQIFQNVATQAVKNKVNWNIKLPGYGETDMFDFLYDTGMSMVDSIAAGTLMGPAGGAFIGVEAATDTMYDAAQSGADTKKAVVQGVLAGAFESLFETVSLSQFKGLQEKGIKKLLSKDGVKQFFRNIGVSTLTNASEETFTEIANIITDIAINGGASGYGEAAKEYMLDGYSEKEARKKAAGDMALQAIAAGAGGALMGGVMGGMGSIFGAITYRTQQKHADRVRGAQLVTEGKTDAVTARAEESKLKEKVMKEAAARREAAAQAKTAEDVAQAAGAAIQADEAKAKEKNKNKPKMSDGRFLESVGELDAQIKNKEIELAVVKRLKEVGEAGDEKQLTKTARAIINTIEGAAYNADEKTIRNSRYGNKVLNELKTAAQGKTYLDNGWAYRMADRLGAMYDNPSQSAAPTASSEGVIPSQSLRDSSPQGEPGTSTAGAVQGNNPSQSLRDSSHQGEPGTSTAGTVHGELEADTTDRYVVKTAKKEYTAQEIQAMPEAQQETVLAAGAYSPEGASVFIANKPENIKTAVYNRSFQTMYTAGQLEATSYDEAAEKNHYAVEVLGESTARAAFNAGLNEVRAARGTAAYTGGIRAEGRYESTAEKKSRIDAVYSAIAAKTGLEIQRVEELTDGQRTANGEYITAAARIIMSEGARNETGDVIHELGHFAADFAGEKYRAAAGAIVRYNLNRYGQESIDSEIRGVMKDYGTDYAAAKEEYINECLAGLFSTDDGMQQFIDWLNNDSGYSEKEKKGILQKLREMLDKVIDILKEVLHRENMSDIAKKQAETELEKAREMRALLLEALDEAGARVKGTGEAKAETGEKKGSFFGKKAKTANVQKLAEAEKLEKDGADIRYSLQSVEDENELLKKENRRLEEINRALRYEYGYAEKGVADAKKVREAASRIKKDVNSSLSPAEIGERLKGIYSRMNGGEWSFESFQAACRSLADELVETSNNWHEPTQESKALLKEIRDTKIKLSDTQKSEAGYSSGGKYGDFYRSVFGKMTIRNDGTPLDIQWQEWASRYPEWFDFDTREPDQPIALKGIIRALSENYDSEWGMYAEEEAEVLTTEIMNEFYKLPNLATRSEQNFQKIEELRKQYKEEYLKALTKVKIVEAAKYRAREVLNRADRQLTIDKAEARTAIVRKVKQLDKLLRNERDDRHIPEELKGTVATLLTFFTKNTSVFNRYMMNDVQKAYAALTSENENADLSDLYDEDIVQSFNELEKMLGDGKRLSQLGLTDLNKIRDIVDHIKFIVDNGNEVFFEGKRRKTAELGKELLNEMDGRQKKYVTIKGEQKDMTALLTDSLTPVYYFERLSDTWQGMYKEIRAGQDKYTDIMENAKEFITSEFRKYNAEKWLESTERRTVETVRGDKIPLTTQEAMLIYATAKRERLAGKDARHLLDGGVVLANNLIKQKDKKRKLIEYTAKDSTKYRLTPIDINAIGALLTEEQKNFTDELVGYLSTNMASYGNETSMQLYGIKKYTEPYYIPYNSDKNYSKIKLGVSDDKKLKNMSMTKRTVSKASTPLIVSDFMSVWAGHVEDMAMYASFAVPIDGIERLYNYKENPNSFTFLKNEARDSLIKGGYDENTADDIAAVVAKTVKIARGEDEHLTEAETETEYKYSDEINSIAGRLVKASENGQRSVADAFERAYGRQAQNYLNTFMKDVNGAVIKDSRDRSADKLLGNFKKAAVMANLSVIVQQPSAVARAFAVINPKYFVASTLKGRGEKTWEECKKYAKAATIKEIGRFDTGIGHSAASWLTDELYDTTRAKMDAAKDKNFKPVFNSIEDAMGFGAELADKITWCHIWQACKQEAKSKYGLEGEAMLKKAGERFSEVVDKTQVYDSTLTRSHMMRSQSMYMKIVTAFMAEPTVSLNMIMDAGQKVKQKGNRGYSAAAVTSVLLQIVFNTALRSFIKAARDDGEESYWEKYLGNLFADFYGSKIKVKIKDKEFYVWDAGITGEFSVGSWIPFVKDLISIFSGYDVERSDMSNASAFIQSVLKLLTANFGGEDEDPKAQQKTVMNVITSAAALFGIPARSIYRDMSGIVNIINNRDVKTTWQGIDMKFNELTGGKSKTNQQIKYLYNAYAQKNEKKKATAESFYDDPKKLEADLKKGLREYDGRILTAAEQFVDGDVDGYMKTAREIINEKTFDEDMIIEAIQAEITQVKKERGITDKDEESTDNMNALFKAEDYYFAVQEGKTKNAEAIKNEIINTAKANGKTEDEAKQYFRGGLISAIKKNDERIDKAAQAWLDGNFKQYKSLIEQIVNEKHFNRDFIEKAAKNARNELKEKDPYMYDEKAVSMFDTDDFVRAAYDGSADMLTDIKAEITGTEISNGKSEDDAEEKFKTDLRASLKEAYQEGDTSPELVTRLLGEYDEQTEEDAANTMTVWDIQKEYPDTTLEAGSIKSYVNNGLADYGIDIPTFEEYHEKHKKCKGTDADGDGKADNGTKQAQIIDVIDALPISSEQKRALFLLDYSAKNCPW